MSEKLLKMSLKLMLFIIFFGIAVQMFGGRTRSILNATGLSKINVSGYSSYISQASSELSLSSDSLSLGSSTEDVKRYISNNMSQIKRLFTTGMWQWVVLIEKEYDMRQEDALAKKT